MSISRAAAWGTLLLAGVTLQDGATAARIDQNDRRERERFLRVWAGDQARYAPDFLAVVDFDERSDDYGRVITTTPLPFPGAASNEPHHVGLSRDGRILAAGACSACSAANPRSSFST